MVLVISMHKDLMLMGNATGSPYVINETTYHGQYHPKILKFENEADGFVVAWSSTDGNSFAVGYQRFNADGSKDGNEVLISTMDDTIDTIVLTATEGDDFQIYAGRTNETFSVSNQAPTSISLDNSSVSENLSGGFIANISGDDPDGDYLTYSVLSDHDGDMLEVNGSVLKFKNGVSADYEQDQVLHFKLKATDLDGLTYEQEFNLNITNDTSDDQSDKEFPQANLSDGSSLVFFHHDFFRTTFRY